MLKDIRALFNLDLEIQSGRGNSESENILETKANQLHEILIYTVWGYSLIFSAINLLNNHLLLALITFLTFPLEIITYVLYKSGYILVSKIWNLAQLNVVITMLAINTTQGGAITVFFIPIIVGTLITLQGKEKIYGYLMSAATIVLMIILLVLDVGIRDPEFNLENIRIERFMNLTSAAIATILEVVFILRLSDKFQDKLVERSVEVNKKNYDLIKANGELDNFVYRVSHDLRSPLLSVKGLLSLVFQSPDLNEKTEGYLRRAETSINRLDETIREILEYSRNSRLAQKLEVFDIRRMVELIFEDLRYLAGPQFNFTFELNGPNEVMSDGYRINTVMRNLISNSVKYRRSDIPDPGLKVTIDNLPKLVTIKVEDNGEGIPENSLPRVFEMFYRGTNTSVGTGLGLYICREVIEKLNGDIRISSTPGKGTLVTIELPVKKP
jgi:signal transduction histidine kinase